MEIGQFNLKKLRDHFTEIGQILHNKALQMDILEDEFDTVRTGKEEFSLWHLKILKDEENKYWRFLDWWKMPKLEEKDLSNLKGAFVRLKRRDEVVIVKLFDILKNIEIVSCVLRFIKPKYYGIFSSPVENILNIRGKAPIDKYLSYLDDLETLKGEYDFKRIADVDMALWVLANILNYPGLRTYPKYRIIYEEYRKRTNPIKIIMAKNSLDQIWEEKNYLYIAKLFADTDHTVAGIIAGREIERFVQNQCDKHKIKREQKASPPALADNLLKGGHITYKENKDIKEWWGLRIKLIHRFEAFVTQDKVEKMIDGIIHLIEKYKSKTLKRDV